MDPVNPFENPFAIGGEPLFTDSLHPSHKIDAEVNTLLLEAKKELSHDAYKEFTAYMRGVARKLKLGAAAIYALNQEPQKIDAEVQRCRYVLQTAADEYSRHLMSFQDYKAAVAATRQENDAAIDAMGRHFERLDIQGRLDSDPMWAHKRAQIDEHMAVAQMGAFIVEKTAEGVKWAAKTVLCTPGTKRERACRVALDVAKETGKQALDAVGLKEPLKKVVEVLATPPQSLVQEMERQFLIPRELAENYCHDSLTLGIAMVPVPPVLKMVRGVAGKVVQPTPKPGLSLPPPVIKNPPLVRGIDIIEAGRAQELAFVKASRASVKPAALPEALPKDAKSLFMHPEVECFPLNPSEGFKVTYTTTGKGAIVLFERDAYSYTAQQLAEIGRGTACDYLPAIFRDVLEFAKKQRLEQLYLAYDQNRIPLLTALKAESERITGMGSFMHHTGTSAKELTLLEMKFTPSMPMRYPEAIARDIDKAVTGKKNLNYLLACEEIGAEELLPVFSLQATQEELWKSVISRYNYPLTSSTAVQYLKRDPRAHIVRVSDKERSYIVKDLLQTSEVATELQGNMFLTSLESPFIQFPTIVAAGRYTEASIERGFLIRSEIPGQTLKEKFAHVGSFASGSQERIAGVAQLWDPSYSLGRGLADIQTKRLQRNRSNLEGFIGSFEDMIDRVHDNLVDIGMNGAIYFERYQTTLTAIKDGFRNEPGRSSCGLGNDISAGQFVCTEGNKFAIAFLDTQDVTFNIGVAKQGIEPVANQYYKMHHMFSCEGLEHGLTLQEVKLMQDAFAQGYLKEYKGVAQDAASRFFDVYHSLDAIANVAEDIASGTAIPKEALGHLIGQLKEKLE